MTQGQSTAIESVKSKCEFLREQHPEQTPIDQKGVSPGIHEIFSNSFFNIAREISLFLFSKLNAWVTLEKFSISNHWLIHFRITIVFFRNHYMIKCSSKSNLRPPCYFLTIHPIEKRKTRVFLNSRTDPFSLFLFEL